MVDVCECDLDLCWTYSIVYSQPQLLACLGVFPCYKLNRLSVFYGEHWKVSCIYILFSCPSYGVYSTIEKVMCMFSRIIPANMFPGLVNILCKMFGFFSWLLQTPDVCVVKHIWEIVGWVMSCSFGELSNISSTVTWSLQ